MYEDRREEIALVLADLVMPGMGGMELAEMLRERDSRARVVLMTGHALGDENGELLKHGHVDWLRKPLDLSELAWGLGRALERDTSPRVAN